MELKLIVIAVIVMFASMATETSIRVYSKEKSKQCAIEAGLHQNEKGYWVK